MFRTVSDTAPDSYCHCGYYCHLRGYYPKGFDCRAAKYRGVCLLILAPQIQSPPPCPHPDPAGLSHPGLCVTGALQAHDLQTHPESAGPGASTPGTPRGTGERTRRPPAESRSPARLPQRPASRADVGLWGAGMGPDHRRVWGERHPDPGPRRPARNGTARPG